MTIFDASEKYRAEGTPLMVLAGKEYGSGSSRDWAAKGPRLLGVRAVLAESFERIHRSNLVGMGILPLQFLEEESAESHGLTGEETFDVVGLTDVLAKFAAGKTVKVRAKKADGAVTEFDAVLRIDTPQEVQYYQHGGILQYVLRSLQGKPGAAKARIGDRFVGHGSSRASQMLSAMLGHADQRNPPAFRRYRRLLP